MIFHNKLSARDHVEGIINLNYSYYTVKLLEVEAADIACPDTTESFCPHVYMMTRHDLSILDG